METTTDFNSITDFNSSPVVYLEKQYFEEADGMWIPISESTAKSILDAREKSKPRTKPVEDAREGFPM